jgi:hypothetical protein
MTPATMTGRQIERYTKYVRTNHRSVERRLWRQKRGGAGRLDFGRLGEFRPAREPDLIPIANRHTRRRRRPRMRTQATRNGNLVRRDACEFEALDLHLRVSCGAVFASHVLTRSDRDQNNDRGIHMHESTGLPASEPRDPESLQTSREEATERACLIESSHCGEPRDGSDARFDG